EEPSPGFLIEHTHRLAGYVVGCCVIGLAVVFWRGERRRWLAYLAVAALLGVIAQGLLGGFRVSLNALIGADLAAIHGCLAQVLFSLLVSLALFTSKSWCEVPASNERDDSSGHLDRLALGTTAAIFAQLVFGAVLRHTHSSVAQRL